VVFRDLHIRSIAGDLRVMPIDGEGNGRVAEYAEVEGVVRVLPEIFAAYNNPLADGLLESGVKLVAIAGVQSARDAGCAEKKRSQHRI